MGNQTYVTEHMVVRTHDGTESIRRKLLFMNLLLFATCIRSISCGPKTFCIILYMVFRVHRKITHDYYRLWKKIVYLDYKKTGFEAYNT
jgi:hypothetical protein